ncbi:unnamed protein product [Urochloa decumbens]|uniref:Phytosulfokine n=1 Tax=Urochloa decumbens TaxID=240449 RepID=A0ABC8WQ80_9POAL
MASSSKQPRATTLLLVAALLFLVCATRGQGARPEPGSKGHTPQVIASVRSFMFRDLNQFQLRYKQICQHAGHFTICFVVLYLQLGVSATMVGDEKTASGPGMEMHQQAEPEAMTECEGEEEGEECLMRRTLVAHTDYIYTQGKHN